MSDYFDQNGNRLHVGDTIIYINPGNSDHNDIGVIEELYENFDSDKIVKARWTKTDNVQTCNVSYVRLKNMRIDSVESAIEFLTSKGYAVTITKTSN
jgi:hypothetical protein